MGDVLVISLSIRGPTCTVVLVGVSPKCLPARLPSPAAHGGLSLRPKDLRPRLALTSGARRGTSQTGSPPSRHAEPADITVEWSVTLAEPLLSPARRQQVETALADLAASRPRWLAYWACRGAGRHRRHPPSLRPLDPPVRPSSVASPSAPSRLRPTARVTPAASPTAPGPTVPTWSPWCSSARRSTPRLLPWPTRSTHGRRAGRVRR